MSKAMHFVEALKDAMEEKIQITLREGKSLFIVAGIIVAKQVTYKMLISQVLRPYGFSLYFILIENPLIKRDLILQAIYVTCNAIHP